MFPIRDMDNLEVHAGEHMVGPVNHYLVERPMAVYEHGSFRFWRGCKVFKIFPGDMRGQGGEVIVEDATVYEFTGDDWASAKAELEQVFDAWMSKWFREGVAGAGAGEECGDDREK